MSGAAGFMAYTIRCERRDDTRRAGYEGLLAGGGKLFRATDAARDAMHNQRAVIAAKGYEKAHPNDHRRHP